MDIPACCSCGACCFAPDDRYVLVDDADYVRLGERASELTHIRSHLCFMRMTDGHCGALEQRADGQFHCSVYEQRPSVCRELARGEHACRVAVTGQHVRVVSISVTTFPHVP